MPFLHTDEYWQDRGPLFFYTGNEGSIETFYENTGFVFELAKDFGALVVFAEHVSPGIASFITYEKHY